MSRAFRRGRTDVQANLTPMIDVTFLLIVFFVLVSQIVEVENVDLLLPELEDPATDLALIRASASGLPYASFGESRGLRVGQLVIAMGNPFGFQSSVLRALLSMPGEMIRTASTAIAATRPDIS